MYCNVTSASLHGLTAELVNVEVDADRGIPSFEMTGFLASEVKEARERVRVAVKNSGVDLLPMRMVVNISPADIRKDGTGFDLPIALALLMAVGIISEESLRGIMVIGELSLNGRINAVRGVLPCVCRAKEEGLKGCIIPHDNISEASIVQGIDIYCVDTLKELIEYLNKSGLRPAGGYAVSQDYAENQPEKLDYSDIKGQTVSKRATMIAVAGMHNIMYIGPPGSGKTMMAKRIPTIMTPLSYEEKLMVTKVYSVAGKLGKNEGLMSERPYRAPHHNITVSGLTGGGRVPMPGEISLAGKGVLFLDEITEFKSEALESLRQPLEDKSINIVRSNISYKYPADFMLVGAMNPCRCGYYPDRNRCSCSQQDIRRYMEKLSNPMWDRFDICVRTQEISFEDITGDTTAKGTGSESGEMRSQIAAAGRIQEERFRDLQINFNAQMGVAELAEYCVLGTKEKELMERIYKKQKLTARGYHKILKVARTIADLEGVRDISCEHLSEACFYNTRR